MSLKMMKTKIFLTFFLLSASIYPASVKDMNKRLKNIDKEIEKKNTRIKAIDTETSKLEKMIKDLEDEIKKLEHEREEIEDEITVVKKNIDYSRKNLEISEVEHDRKESEFVAKIIAWDKYSKVHRKEIDEKVLLTKNYREMLHGDLQRMGHIEKVTGSIKEAKEKVEAEKKKLDRLEAELKENLRKSDAKKEEQKKLKEKLQVEKKGHQSSIEKLKKEKQRISKEIERIIRENARRAAEKAAREKAAREAAKNKGKGKGKSSGGTKVTTTTVDMPKISNPEAYKRIGKTIKPLNGQIVVYFRQKKAGVVESNGIEIKGKLGNPIVASKGGTVIYANAFQGLGKVVMIDYGGGIIGVYGNLLAIKVGLNSRVSAGQTIGVLGLSSDKEPNLYYELRANLRPIDPIPTF
ncbi:peptidoglycan DD-metalloendopeptidase family protein [Fusobacterium animalis]|uniref:murein hydrolase activator EnvC family protein n=1 Tax=Fusobacterium animalis TaxID=76859 RepID=UPI00049523BF|nr:peptidoglycan DD-metalloendopeptidase family protein [Fusobacterium animalis]ALF22098.1 peptidase M23 [Fusobacterium animalis]